MGNLLTDKYAEGYPGHRFYAGCDNVDAIEAEAPSWPATCSAPSTPTSSRTPAPTPTSSRYCRDPRDAHRGRLPRRARPDQRRGPVRRAVRRACATELHGASSCSALDYYSGGHLTHGYRLNISSQLFDAHSYSVDPRDRSARPRRAARQAREVRPLILLAGYCAYPRAAQLRQAARDRRRGRRGAYGRHGALRRPGRGQGLHRRLRPGRARARRHHAPRTRRCAARAAAWCSRSRSTPRRSTRAARRSWAGRCSHVMAAKAVALREASQPAFRTYAAADRRQRPGAGRGAAEARRRRC